MENSSGRISRSRSPRAEKSRRHEPSRRDRRSRSPTSKSHHTSRRHHHQSSRNHKDEHREKVAAVSLPYGARTLVKEDLPNFREFFGYFLSVQKQIELDEIEEREVKGRWKSFVGKWNRGELAEGWYDPEMFARVTGEPRTTDERERQTVETSREQDIKVRKLINEARQTAENHQDADSDDEYGPALPSSTQPGRRSGPGVPSLDDLTHRNELLASDADTALSSHRLNRKAERTLQKERLDELAPRADAGTRERKLEKRQAVNDKMREFRDKSPGGEVGDTQLMGGEEDSLQELRKARESEQRKKSEREIKREEFERARQEERDERKRVYNEKEEQRMKGFKELARQRFG